MFSLPRYTFFRPIQPFLVRCFPSLFTVALFKMLASTFLIFAGLASLSTAAYTLEDDYEPSSFFSMFDFFTVGPFYRFGWNTDITRAVTRHMDTLHTWIRPRRRMVVLSTCRTELRIWELTIPMLHLAQDERAYASQARSHTIMASSSLTLPICLEEFVGLGPLCE